MENKKIKAIVFIAMSAAMIYFICWVFYKSEPEYIDNCKKKVESYDYVSVKKYSRSDNYNDAFCGIVMQVGEDVALVKRSDMRDKMVELDLSESKYRIVGRGTIYHKVNSYVGFNVMIVVQSLIVALLIVVMIAFFSTLHAMLKK